MIVQLKGTKSYLITYELESYDETYPAIAEYLRSCPNWARVGAHTWFVRTRTTAGYLRDELKKLLKNEEDQVMVVQTTDAEWATYAVSKEVTDWMKDNV
ncbi:MAG: hypothetical protein K5854_03665 [Prevotella sp.]|jgi:hypothetical protein|nr:hypothetical protein [Prevotella sp.]